MQFTDLVRLEQPALKQHDFHAEPGAVLHEFDEAGWSGLPPVNSRYRSPTISMARGRPARPRIPVGFRQAVACEVAETAVRIAGVVERNWQNWGRPVQHESKGIKPRFPSAEPDGAPVCGIDDVSSALVILTRCKRMVELPYCCPTPGPLYRHDDNARSQRREELGALLALLVAPVPWHCRHRGSSGTAPPTPSTPSVPSSASMRR
jgi:hypothetical protein